MNKTITSQIDDQLFPTWTSVRYGVEAFPQGGARWGRRCISTDTWTGRRVPMRSGGSWWTWWILKIPLDRLNISRCLQNASQHRLKYEKKGRDKYKKMKYYSIYIYRYIYVYVFIFKHDAKYCSVIAVLEIGSFCGSMFLAGHATCFSVALPHKRVKYHNNSRPRI